MRKTAVLAMLCMTGLMIGCGQTSGTHIPDAQVSNITPQVIGGVESKPHSHPYAVTVGVPVGKNGELGWCGGVLISKEWVMTAAHCAMKWKPEEFVVRVGVHNAEANPPEGEQISVVKRITHSKVNIDSLWTTGYDIALLKLSKPVSDPNAVPINLPSDRIESVLVKDKSRAVLMGWGATIDDKNQPNSPVLNEVDIPISPSDVCLHPKDQDKTIKPPNTLCQPPEKDKSSCYGDSGGPVAQSYKGKMYILGMSSYGYGCTGHNVFTRVNSYLHWIKKHTGIDAATQDTEYKSILLGYHRISSPQLNRPVTVAFSDRDFFKDIPENTKTILVGTANVGKESDKARFRMIVSTEQNRKVCDVIVYGDSKTFCRVDASQSGSLKVRYQRLDDFSTVLTTQYFTDID